jgi:hypothetical protein
LFIDPELILDGTMRKLLFLDFDGVLHPTTCTPAEMFDRAELLDIALDGSSVEIVISSSWRHHHPLHDLIAKLSPRLADRVVGHTGDAVIGRFARHQEILRYLSCVKEPFTWCALDDSKFEFPPNLPNLIACNPNHGLTHELGNQLKMWAHAVDAANSTQSGSYDMAFYDVLNLIREHNDASVAFVQRHTLFGYRRAKAILESMEGKYVTKPFSDGIRRVVIDPSLG